MELLIVILFFMLLILNIWVLLLRPRKPRSEKIAFVLEIIGVYTFAFGILSQTQIFEEFGALAKDMTSQNLFEFLRGNFQFLSIFTSTLAVAFEPLKVAYGPLFLYFIELIVLFTFAALGFVYAAIHILVIMPISYIAYFLSSALVNSIVTSANDIIISIGSDVVNIKAVVASNPVVVKNLVIAIPAMATALTGKMIPLFRRTKKLDPR